MYFISVVCHGESPPTFQPPNQLSIIEMPTPDQDSPFARIPIDERTAATPLGRTLIKLREYNPTLEEREALRKASGQVVGRCVYLLNNNHIRSLLIEIVLVRNSYTGFVGAGVGGFLANYVARQRKWSFRPRLAVSVGMIFCTFSNLPH